LPQWGLGCLAQQRFQGCTSDHIALCRHPPALVAGRQSRCLCGRGDGQAMPANHDASTAALPSYPPSGLRSNQWPGAFCACQGSRFTNVYVGWGVKNAAFVPLPPPPVRGGRIHSRAKRHARARVHGNRVVAAIGGLLCSFFHGQSYRGKGGHLSLHPGGPSCTQPSWTELNRSHSVAPYRGPRLPPAAPRHPARCPRSMTPPSWRAASCHASRRPRQRARSPRTSRGWVNLFWERASERRSC
jgi:hypothetical protein